jgi:hypothetical protein
MPERIMEWLLLGVPPDLFEAGLQGIGLEAKRYAVFGVAAGLGGVLNARSAVAVRRQASIPQILALTLVRLLGVMLVVLPLTSAGCFARDLVEGMSATAFGYLSIALPMGLSLHSDVR